MAVGTNDNSKLDSPLRMITKYFAIGSFIYSLPTKKNTKLPMW